MQRIRDENPAGAITMPKLLAIIDKDAGPSPAGMNQREITEYQDEKLAQRVSKALQQAQKAAGPHANAKR